MIKQKEWRKITDSRFRFGFFVKRTTSTRFVDPTQQTESRPTRRREPGQREMKRQKQGSKDSYNWNSNCFQFTLIALETRLEILYSSLSHFSLGLKSTAMHIALTVDDKTGFANCCFLWLIIEPSILWKVLGSSSCNTMEMEPVQIPIYTTEFGQSMIPVQKFQKISGALKFPKNWYKRIQTP